MRKWIVGGALVGVLTCLLLVAFGGDDPPPFDRLQLLPTSVSQRFTATGVSPGGDPDSDRQAAGRYHTVHAILRYPPIWPDHRADLVATQFAPGYSPSDQERHRDRDQSSGAGVRDLFVHVRLALRERPLSELIVQRVRGRRPGEVPYARVLEGLDGAPAFESGQEYVRLDLLAAQVRERWLAVFDAEIAACGDDDRRRRDLENRRADVEAEWESLRPAWWTR